MTMTAAKRSVSSVQSAQVRDLDDAALAEAMLRREDGAWREFVRRFEPSLRKLISKTMARSMRLVLDSDALDDVMGDFHLAILENDMRKVRAWVEGGRKSRLVRWLGLIARGIAIDHIRIAFNHQSERVALEDDDHEVDPKRAAKFNSLEKAMTEPRVRIVDGKHVFAWFGDEWVLIYGEEGQEIDRFLVGVDWRRKLKPSDVEAIITRRITRNRRAAH